MALKGQKQTKKWKRNMSEIMSGRKLSKEHKRKLSEAHKASNNHAGQFKKGHKINIGRVKSEETRQRMKKARQKWVKENSDKIPRGENAPMYGKHHSEETKKKISENNYWKGRDMKLHPSWKGGKWTDSRGYVHVWKATHPRTKDRYILEHRLVMEKHLGRELYPWEIVHHKNGIENDNRIENLELLPSGKHNKIVQEVYKENLFLKEQLANFMNIAI